MNSRRTSILIIMAVAAIVVMMPVTAQRRRMTPVDNPSTVTQSVNETKNDTAHINAARRARSVHYHDDNGNVVYLDTVTGEEWRDSTAIMALPKMKYPLIFEGAVGINIWDPVMRAFGQHYGLADAWVELSLYNRYKPIFEFGLGQAKYTPSDGNYTYKSPTSVYFRLGANYNFLYNSSPDYQFFGGLRYGFSPFSYSVTNITVDSPYWDETVGFDIPSRNATAGWLEVVFGLKVKLWGPISAGWTIKYSSLLHCSTSANGKPWYIPGFGTRGTSLGGSFSISYTLPLNKAKTPEVIEEKLPETGETLPPDSEE